MSDGTKIEWTEATWNPITGCSVTSPGCTNCYAMKLAGTRLAHHPSRTGLTTDTKAGPVWTGETRFNEEWLTQPLKWRRPRRIFVCAHGDLFHESVPDEWIDRVFAVMALASQHTFQVLTKRAARMREYVSRHDTSKIGDSITTNAFWLNSATRGYRGSGGSAVWPLPNVWLGVSVEDQARADERIPDLLATPAAVRWLSCEPLLGPVDLGELQEGLPANAWLTWLDGLDWIVIGGESGPGARPMHPDWVRSLRDQCAAAGVPFFFKQWGEWAPVYDRERTDPDWRKCGEIERMYPGGRWLNLAGGSGFHGEMVNYVSRTGKAWAGRMLDGVEYNGYPE